MEVDLIIMWWINIIQQMHTYYFMRWIIIKLVKEMINHVRQWQIMRRYKVNKRY
jgi:hypothetical protein